MLPGTQNTVLVLVCVISIFLVIILTVLCGEYIFNFESKRLRAAEKVSQAKRLFGSWWRPDHSPILHPTQLQLQPA